MKTLNKRIKRDLRFCVLGISLVQVALFVISASTIGCTSKGSTKESLISLRLKNESDLKRKEILMFSSDEVPAMGEVDWKPGIVQMEDAVIELIDGDNDGKTDVMLLQVELQANENKILRIDAEDLKRVVANAVKKTQAEISIKKGGEWQERKYVGGEFENISRLRVPVQHTDHSYFIRYEGPGLENEMVGYRYYLDWRNAMDVFGKKVDSLVLQDVGQDGFDSYHEPAPWGMDVLKAGKSLGIGSIGHLNGKTVEHFEKTDSVTTNVSGKGYLSSSVHTRYYGWQTSSGKHDIGSKMTINTGDRAVRHDVYFESPVPGFCTGIVKNNTAELIESLVGSTGWAYLATYGKQSLADDNLGLAILYNAKEVQQIADGEHDHLLVFKPTSGKVSYYLIGAWEQEKNGITNKEQFKEYLDRKISLLNQSLQVSFGQ